MNKVWIVTTGCYSDYRIVGVFTSKENADLFVSAAPDDGDVEEWNTDTFEPVIDQLRQGRKPWTICMDRDGNVPHSYNHLPVLFRQGDYEYEEGMSNLGLPRDRLRNAHNGSGGELRAVRWATTVEGAIKSVNETRAQLIATEQWPRQYLNDVELSMRPYTGGVISDTLSEAFKTFDLDWQDIKDKLGAQ